MVSRATTWRGYSPSELALLEQHTHDASDFVRRLNPEAAVLVSVRMRRMRATRWEVIRKELERRQIPRADVEWISLALDRPDDALRWFSSTVENVSTYYVGGKAAVAVDLLAFLRRIEGKDAGRGRTWPGDLIEEYVLRQVLATLDGLNPGEGEAIVARVLARGDAPELASLDRAIAVFVRGRMQASPTAASLLLPENAARKSSPLQARPENFFEVQAPERASVVLPLMVHKAPADPDRARRWVTALVCAAGLAVACALTVRTMPMPGWLRAALIVASALSAPLGLELAARLARMRSESRAIERAAVLTLLALSFGALATICYRDVRMGLHAISAYVWLGLGATLVATALGMVRGNRIALFVGMLFGIPLELPYWPLGRDEELLKRKARWLADFLKEKPRGYNTPGAHLACGVIGVKKALKALCLRRERADEAVRQLERRHRRLLRQRNRLNDGAARALVRGDARAVELSRREYGMQQAIDGIERRLLRKRIQIQDQVVDTFARAWAEVHQEGLVSREIYHAAALQFRQPADEPPALLPNGLVRSPVAFTFEYGMFFGRIALAVLFLATLQISYLFWAVILLVLDMYVVEPVVLKLHIGSFNLLLDIPGHKMVDLKRYIEENPTADGVFRVPITVPKFSSNPAWVNLSAIIQRATSRSGVATKRIVPFAMRRQQRETVIELEQQDSPEATRAFAAALRAELAESAARFPLAADVYERDSCVIVELSDEPSKIWGLIGEDASQAFIYLRRNLNALADTLRYLGPRFVPVFILASNSVDEDVIEYELEHIAELQAISERQYGGQVGFLYLLRGGEWYNYNAHAKEFEQDDKEFKRALGQLKQRLVKDASSAQEYLFATLVRSLDTEHFAKAFNNILGDRNFYRSFDKFDFDRLPPHLRPSADTMALLHRARHDVELSRAELLHLNRELLLTAMPFKIRGGFFKKVGNDIPVQELIVAGRSKPMAYIDRSTSEHVRDPNVPNFVKVWGDFARYTGLMGTNERIQEAILKGRDLEVKSIPELGAVIDDKNDFAPGEFEKGLRTMLHPENRHIAIGVPRINITFPEYAGRTMCSEYVIGAQAARESHNTADGQSRARIFDFSSAAYGKWFKRPQPYLAHYVQEVLNAAHALSHDFQQSYLVAGAAGRLASFSEALYGPNRFRVQAAVRRPQRAGG